MISAGERMSDEILSVYKEILGLINSNPEKVDITYILNLWLKKHIPYDFGHYVVNDVNPISDGEKLSTHYERWLEPGNTNNFSNIIEVPYSNNTSGGRFKEMAERNRQQAIAQRERKFPSEVRHYHYHEFISFEQPEAVLGILDAKQLIPIIHFLKQNWRPFRY
jgi:hypothetical protein